MKKKGASVASLLSLLALGQQALTANVVHMSISRRNPEINVVRRNLSARHFARATITESLLNNVTGGSYMADVMVGTPGQPLSLVIDTGSSDAFVLASTADECTEPEIEEQYGYCSGGTYNSNDSSTYKMVDEGGFSIQYEDGTGSSGDYISDTFEIGGANVSNLQMGVAFETTVGVGIMGIGYRAGESVSTRNQYPNLIDQMVSQKKINSRAYSLYLDDIETTTGTVLFGGIDAEKFIGTLKSLPIQQDPEEEEIISFTVLLSSISINEQSGNPLQITGFDFPIPVVLDSGTTITYLPDPIVEEIISKLDAYDDSSDSGYIYVDCHLRTTHSNASFSFGFGDSGGPTINVPFSEMILNLPPDSFEYEGAPFSETCFLGMSSSDDTYLLGDTFLRSAYVVYDIDHNEIGLAQTNFQATAVNVQEIPASATGIPLMSGVATGMTQVPLSEITAAASISGYGAAASATGSAFATGTVSIDLGPGSIPTGIASVANAPTVTVTTTPTSAAAGMVPEFERGTLAVLALSLGFAALGGSWFHM